jgi:hypothetical protein
VICQKERPNSEKPRQSKKGAFINIPNAECSAFSGIKNLAIGAVTNKIFMLRKAIHIIARTPLKIYCKPGIFMILQI